MASLTLAQRRALAYYAAGGDCLAKGAPRRDVTWSLHCLGLVKVTRGVRGAHIVVVITTDGQVQHAQL